MVLRLGSNLIMTRLLAPEMFGVIALAFVLLTAINLFSDIGLNQNIVQHKRGGERRFLNTVWTLQIMRGVLIAVFMLLLGGGFSLAAQIGWLPSDSTYASPDLPLVIMALSSIAIIDGLKSTKVATAGRNLVVGRVTAINLITQITSICVMIAIALDWPTIWVLVIGYVTGHSLGTLLSHVALKGESNALCWDVPIVKEVIGFGKWIFFSSILGFLVNSADKWVLGFVLSPVAFGAYAIAALILDALSSLFVKISSAIALPALSEVNRKDPARVKSVYYKIRRPIDAAAILLSGYLFVTGHLWIDILYDDRYQLAGELLEIIALQIGLWQLRISGEAFIATGRPRFLTIVIVARLITMVILVAAIGQFAGKEYVIWGIVLSILVTVPATFYLKSRCGLLSLKTEALSILFVPVGLALGYATLEIADWLGF